MLFFDRLVDMIEEIALEVVLKMVFLAHLIEYLINVLLNVPTGFTLDRVRTHQIQHNKQNMCNRKIEKENFEQFIVS
jgi:hypothetical protein